MSNYHCKKTASICPWSVQRHCTIKTRPYWARVKVPVIWVYSTTFSIMILSRNRIRRLVTIYLHNDCRGKAFVTKLPRFGLHCWWNQRGDRRLVTLSIIIMIMILIMVMIINSNSAGQVVWIAVKFINNDLYFSNLKYSYLRYFS